MYFTFSNNIRNEFVWKQVTRLANNSPFTRKGALGSRPSRCGFKRLNRCRSLPTIDGKGTGPTGKRWSRRGGLRVR